MKRMILLVLVFLLTACSSQQEESTEINEYAQLVGDAIMRCFTSHVTETENPDEYIADDGSLIKVIEFEGLTQATDELGEEDIANGVLWENYIRMDVMIYDGEEWEDVILFDGDYRYYQDGTIERKFYTSDGIQFLEFGQSCHLSWKEAGILW